MGMLTFRRYRALKATAAVETDQAALAGVHKAAHAATTPTTIELPADFPARELLANATPTPITHLEDLYGATEAELTRITGIGPATARRILAARDALDEA